MKPATSIAKSRKWFLIACLVATAVIAKTISIDVSKKPYDTVAPAIGIDVYTSGDLKIAALLGLMGMYRVTNGILSAPIGTIIEVKWSDGSAEQALVACLVGTPCVQPIPGTQRGAPGGGGGSVTWDGAAGDGAGAGGFGGFGGFDGGFGGTGDIGLLETM